MKTLLLILSLAFFVGCASFQTTSGKLLQSTALTVDGSMHGWATWVAHGQATDAQQLKVSTIYKQYQVSMATAQGAWVAAVTTGNQTAWGQASAALTAIAGNLIALVASFTTPTTTTSTP